MHYSVCASAVFSGAPLPEALSSVREAGYDRYEFWSWWDQDLDALVRAQGQQQLSAAAMCTRFIPLTDPACRAEYIAGLEETIEASERLGCASLISQVGQEMPGIPRERQHSSIVEGLRACVPMLRASGRTLVIEPLNTKIDHQGYYLWQSEEAFRIVDAVGHPCVRVLYDVYHQHIMGEDTAREIQRNIDKIGHIHIAGYPGRHELLGGELPGGEFLGGEIDLGPVLEALTRGGYAGAVGLEYFPVGDPVEGLRVLRERFPLG